MCQLGRELSEGDAPVGDIGLLVTEVAVREWL